MFFCSVWLQITGFQIERLQGFGLKEFCKIITSEPFLTFVLFYLFVQLTNPKSELFAKQVTKWEKLLTLSDPMISESSCPMKLAEVLYNQIRNIKSNMAAPNPVVKISRRFSALDNRTVMSTAISMFSGSGCLMGLVRTLYDQTWSGKFKTDPEK